MASDVIHSVNHRVRNQVGWEHPLILQKGNVEIFCLSMLQLPNRIKAILGTEWPTGTKSFQYNLLKFAQRGNKLYPPRQSMPATFLRELSTLQLWVRWFGVRWLGQIPSSFLGHLDTWKQNLTQRMMCGEQICGALHIHSLCRRGANFGLMFTEVSVC